MQQQTRFGDLRFSTDQPKAQKQGQEFNCLPKQNPIKKTELKANQHLIDWTPDSPATLTKSAGEERSSFENKAIIPTSVRLRLANDTTKVGARLAPYPQARFPVFPSLRTDSR